MSMQHVNTVPGKSKLLHYKMHSFSNVQVPFQACTWVLHDPVEIHLLLNFVLKSSRYVTLGDALQRLDLRGVLHDNRRLLYVCQVSISALTT